QVATAAEFAPDDYLLKPFTSGTLHARLERILEKKEALAPIYRHMGERGDPLKALAACDELLAQGGRHVLDVERLKGELLLTVGKIDEARALYESILARRSTPWAEVGRARCLAAVGDETDAREHLAKTLEAYPNYLAAYDSLAGMLQKSDGAAAQEVVEQALKVAPSTRRQRQLGALALENKDYARAETAYRKAVDRDRTGFFKSHDDYAGLAKSCSEQGKTQEALAAVKDMAQHFTRTPELEARQAAVESLIYAKAGNPDLAATALDKALAIQARNGNGGLDPATALEIAQACFVDGRKEAAKQIIQDVAEDFHENDEVFARAQAVFASAGLKEEGEIFLEATRKRMIKLNNDAVALAKEGRLEQAIGMLEEAADRLRNNCQVSLNAAIALLMRIRRDGPNAEHFEQAHRYIMQALAANPAHPKLDEAITIYRQVATPDAPVIELPPEE
ncbi:MAG TPA: tetratricopeptide repeat protein, partial [Rhodocyclaceae bacterium]|nr:tetratricopeptide repeat protein [Rhodocyclaceae bacterium]